VAGGEKLEVCECFAEESSRRLENPMFELVVLGAQGRESEAEEVMKSLARIARAFSRPSSGA
jgi:hypothetical protein